MSERVIENATSWKEKVPRVDWIQNEGLLRDEGTLHGLVGSKVDINLKLKAIAAFFQEKKQHLSRAYELLQDEQSTLEEQRISLLDREETLREQLQEIEHPEAEEQVERHSSARYLLGFLLAAGTCIANWWVVFELIRPAFEDPEIIATGVLLAGLFSVFEPNSLLYAADDSGSAKRAELWKVRLLEFGMPLAAAGFTVAWRWREIGWEYSLISFAFLFMLFLFCGKLLLTVLPRLALITRRFRLYWQKRGRRRELRDELDQLREEKLPAIDEQARQIRLARTTLPSLEAVDRELIRAQSLFQSEVDLARIAFDSGTITSTQMTDIIASKEDDHV